MPNDQNLNSYCLDHWILEFVWSLEFGVWNLNKEEG